MNAIRIITREVAKMRGVAITDILSDRRTRTFIQPRHEVMYFARQLTPASLPAIGRRLGGRDHTTVMYGIQMVESRIETVVGYGDELEAMAVRIRQALPGEGQFDLVPTDDVDAQAAAKKIAAAIAAGEKVAVYADEVAAIAGRMLELERQVTDVSLRVENIQPISVTIAEVKSPPQVQAVTDMPALVAAAKAAAAAWGKLQSDRFSARERFSQGDFERAFNTLKSSLKTEGLIQ